MNNIEVKPLLRTTYQVIDVSHNQRDETDLWSKCQTQFKIFISAYNVDYNFHPNVLYLTSTSNISLFENIFQLIFYEKIYNIIMEAAV